MLTGRKQSRPIDDFEDQGDGSSQGWPSRSLVRILWKHKVHVLVSWAALSAVVIAVVMAWPATYRAETLILVDQQKIPEKFVSSTVNAELQDRLATLSQEILSQTRLQKIIQTLNLYENERKTRTQEEILEMMAGDISVTAEKGWIQNRPGAFRVAYSGRNPATVAEVANQLGSLFIEENLRSRENMAAGTADFMKTQLDQAKKELEAQEVKLSQFKQAFNGELPQQEASLAQELSQLQLQLQGSQDALNRANQNKTVVESALSVAQSTEATLQRLIENANHRTPAQVVALAAKKKSEELETQLAEMKLRYSPAHPDIKAMMAAIEQAKATEAAESVAVKEATEGSEGSGTTDEAQAALAQSPDAVRALSSERERVALGWLHTAHFLTSAPQLEHLPPVDLPEIAFVGRSNAGKSTCINTLTRPSGWPSPPRHRAGRRASTCSPWANRASPTPCWPTCPATATPPCPSRTSCAGSR